MPNLIEILIVAPPILLALTVHEYAHALVAYRLGDPTAKEMGRLTLNPLSHLDPIGTITLFIAHIGWAKPVPVNPIYFHDPRRDMLWVSLAGPGSNLIAAFGFGLIFRLMRGWPEPGATGLSIFGIFLLMVYYGVTINLILAFFNLIPIPPLDGSKILMSLLPAEKERKYQALARYGPIALLVLILSGRITGISLLWFILSPFIKLFSLLFAGYVPGGF